MDFNKELNNLSNLKDTIERLGVEQNQAFSKLSPEDYEKVKDMHLDVNTLLQKFKAGDFNALDKLTKDITKKYENYAR